MRVLRSSPPPGTPSWSHSPAAVFWDLKTLGMAPASRSCIQRHPGHGRAVFGTGCCRQESCWTGSGVRRGAPATSTSRAASPPSAGPCTSTSLSPGLAAWPCWASRSSPCSSPSAFITTSTERMKGSREELREQQQARMLCLSSPRSPALIPPQGSRSPGCSHLRST